MAKTKGTLEQLWTKENNARRTSLEMARLCAAITKPATLPPEGATADTILQENFQSLGAYIINNLGAQLVSGLWPPMLPWFKLVPSPAVLYNPKLPPKQLEQIQHALFLRELTIQSILETAGSRGTGRRLGFRSHKQRVMNSLLITGDTLEKMEDDYSFRSFRRDTYTNRLDSSGNVMFHMIRELIDPARLSRRQLEDAGIDEDDIDGAHGGRDVRDAVLTTRVEYHVRTKKWVIEQSVNGNIIRLGTPGKEKDMASEETVSPYFWTPYSLVDGEHYGRGFVETGCKADLRSLDEIMERILDWAGLASKAVPCIGEDSNLRASDLAMPHGVPIRCRVVDGRPTDWGFASVNKLNDLGFVKEVMQELESRVANIGLLSSGSVRDSERTTAFEVQRTTLKELDLALSGAYPSISDHQQDPNVRLVIHRLERDLKSGWKKLPDGSVDIQILTGMAALVKASKVQDLMDLATLAKDLEALNKLNSGAYIDAVARYKNIYEPAIIRSNEEVEAENQKMLRLQAQAQAQQQAIQSAGAIAENAAATRMQPGAPARQ